VPRSGDGVGARSPCLIPPAAARPVMLARSPTAVSPHPVTTLATMELFFALRRRRCRRHPHAQCAQRRARHVGRASPRPVAWWFSSGLLVLAWFPLTATAQGLRSTTTSVSLVATRLPDPARQGQDVTWDVGAMDDSVATIHLVEGPVGTALYVRDTNGRLQALGAAGVTVRAPRVVFRIVGAAPPHAGAAWRVVLRSRGPGGASERPWEVRPAQPR
jgi:hypothetical protein